jgi:hypothetical protein
MDFPCLWPRGCADGSTELVKLVEVADKGETAERNQFQLVFCGEHAKRVMERDEWFGPSQWRDEGWFVGVESERFDLGALLAGQSDESKFIGRAVAHMSGLVPRG